MILRSAIMGPIWSHNNACILSDWGVYKGWEKRELSPRGRIFLEFVW